MPADISVATLLVGFIVSTVGFSLFLYGKKQARPPQLIAGLVMMLAPFVVTDALWMAVSGVALTAGLWGAVRAGH